jgi:hypothetical protein
MIETMSKELAKAEESGHALQQVLHQKQSEIYRLNEMKTFSEAKIEQLNLFIKKLFGVNEKLTAQVVSMSPTASPRPFAVLHVNRKVTVSHPSTRLTSSTVASRQHMGKTEADTSAIEYYKKMNEFLLDEYSRIKQTTVKSLAMAAASKKVKKPKKTLINSRKSEGDANGISPTANPGQHVTVIHMPESRSTYSVDDYGHTSPLKGMNATTYLNSSYESSGAYVGAVINSLEEEYDAINTEYKALVQAVKRLGGDSAQANRMILLLQRLQSKEDQIKKLKGISD